MAPDSDRDELVERARGGDRDASTALFALDRNDSEFLALRRFEVLSNEEVAAEFAIERAAANERSLRALVRPRPASEALAPDSGPYR